MKTLFQRWLVVFVSIAFLVTVFISYRIQSRQALKQAEELLRVNLEDAVRQLDRTQKNLKIIETLNKKSALAKARAVS